MDFVKIQGYKSFKKIAVCLHPINLLIGANGAGKSNFLSLFEMLGNLYEKRVASYVAQMGGVNKFFYQGLKQTEKIEIEIGQKLNSYVLSLMESDGKLLIAHEKLGYSYFGQLSTVDIGKYQEEAGLKDYDGMRRGDYIKGYISQIRKFHFHDTGRRSPFTADSHIVNDAYRMYEHGENLAAILYRIQREKPVAYRRIIRVIQSVAPYFSDFYFQPTEADMVRLQWQDKYSSMIYGPTDLSDGTIRFIALTVLFMQPWLPRVIIIDEPELGLHPVAIEKLSGLIKMAAQKGTQVIVATQSAELISNFEPEDVLTVNQNEDGTTINRLNSEELAHWLEDYTLGDLWKQNIMKGDFPYSIFNPTPIPADETFSYDIRQKMKEVYRQVQDLRLGGVSDWVLKQYLFPPKNLSRMIITENYDIILPDYHDMTIKMEPLVKAVYILFLRHEEGILFKCLSDYREELYDIYVDIRKKSNNNGAHLSEEKIRQSIEALTNPLSNSINEKCARIRQAFTLQFDESLAGSYFIDGNRGEPKKIPLDRKLVEWK